MHQDRQAACWGSFPRRQRRLPRSRLFARRIIASLILPTAGCAAVVIAVASHLPLP